MKTSIHRYCTWATLALIALAHTHCRLLEQQPAKADIPALKQQIIALASVNPAQVSFQGECHLIRDFTYLMQAVAVPDRQVTMIPLEQLPPDGLSLAADGAQIKVRAGAPVLRSELFSGQGELKSSEMLTDEELNVIGNDGPKLLALLQSLQTYCRQLPRPQGRSLGETSDEFNQAKF